MLSHDQFRRLCEQAMEAPASPEELAGLLSHIRDCEPCREVYERSLMATEERLGGPSPIPNSPVHDDPYRKRFLGRARAAGVRFSGEVEGRKRPAVGVCSPIWKLQYVFAIAVVLLVILVGVRTYRRKESEKTTIAKLDDLRARNVELQRMNGQLGRELSLAQGQREVIADKFSQLTDQIASEQRDLFSEAARVSDLQLRLIHANADVRSLTASAEEDERAFNSRLQQQAQNTAQMTDRIRTLQFLGRDQEAMLAAREADIDKLTAELKVRRDSLGREERLLAADRDVRDLIGARNLHIVDICDTDGQGRETQAFGRVFYTEGKSLIFYAFDLDHLRSANPKVSFVGWATYPNARVSPKALGIFFADDGTQRRWVLKVDNGEALREIDAVFVTVEAHSDPANRPTGQKLLYAYLNSQANHP